MATLNVNIPPGWRIRMLTVKNRRAHRACHQHPRHLPCCRAALYPQVQLSSGGASELRKRQDSTSLKQGQKRRRKTKASSANTTRLRRRSDLLQMSDMLALREHLSPVKKQQHTARNYSTARSPPDLSMSTILHRGMSVQKKTSATKRPFQGSQAICPT
jgi:hypothetical protein